MKTSSWHRVTTRCLPDAEDAVALLLTELGSNGVEIVTAAGGNSEIIAHYPQSENISQIVETILGLAGVVSVDSTSVTSDDWASNWKQYYHPQRITRHLTVVPSWDQEYQASAGELVIRLDPDTAFGTGTHPTTKLALYALEQTMRGGETVIDVGTGSGVLTIAASLLGGSTIIATDIDDEAIAIAANNIKANPLTTSIELLVSDGLTSSDRKVNLIVANILAEVLFNIIDDAAKLLLPGGHLILSGIYFDKIESIKQKLKYTDLEVTTEMSQANWYALVASKPESE